MNANVMAVGLGTATSSPSFASALRGELVLMRHRVAVRAGLIVWATCIALFAYLVAYISTVNAPWYTPEQQDLTVNAMLPQGTGFYMLTSLPMYGAPQMAILGAVLGASDYGRGTIRTIAARFPSRRSLIAARLTNLVVIAGAVAVTTMLASILSSLAIAVFTGRGLAFPSGSALLLATLIVWLVAATFVALGFALGTIMRNAIAAAVSAAAWVLGVESLFIGMLSSTVPFLHHLQGFLPVGATSSIVSTLSPTGLQTATPITASTPPGVAVGVLVGWLATSGATSYIAFCRRDLT